MTYRAQIEQVARAFDDEALRNVIGYGMDDERKRELAAIVLDAIPLQGSVETVCLGCGTPLGGLWE